MPDHVTLGVSDLVRAAAFYDHALAPLGIRRLHADGVRFAGYGLPTNCSSGSATGTR